MEGCARRNSASACIKGHTLACTSFCRKRNSSDTGRKRSNRRSRSCAGSATTPGLCCCSAEQVPGYLPLLANKCLLAALRFAGSYRSSRVAWAPGCCRETCACKTQTHSLFFVFCEHTGNCHTHPSLERAQNANELAQQHTCTHVAHRYRQTLDSWVKARRHTDTRTASTERSAPRIIPVTCRQGHPRPGCLRQATSHQTLDT